ncbi:AhpD family alkylhydroperoxidase [Aquimarina sp. MAR_2010_214]|uniref:carboxymuconolactone decarboxylase family protein n=1 Tax=Aquimarina sp. MAR_2010_214 TaxID=1250026 RepID=UPI000C701822|nr:carboxymuconolactone decarboxylase family protein [Aquimarina sp. MAR_2010_214]PKV51927.1 AhpD family alkylhydroperoxidase [Aquimarina sp. MAR_2010_214]
MNKDPRINVLDLEPNAYKAMLAMEQYLADINIAPQLKELIKIRASYINGCAYCIDMHTVEAQKINIEARKLFALAVWKESTLFSGEERAALALTDEITRIAENGVSSKVYNTVNDYFDEHQIAQLIMLIVSINSWNRIAVATKMEF